MKPDTGTRVESEDKRFSLGLSGPINGMTLSPLHATGTGAVDPKDPEAGGPPAVPLTVLPRSLAPPYPARGVRYLCRQPALWPRCTRASKRLLTENNSLRLKKSECLRGSLRILSLTSGVGGEDAMACGPLQLPTAEGSNMGVERGSEARQMGPLRETGLGPGSDPRLAPGDSRSSLHPERRGPAGFRGPSGSPQPPEDGPPIRSHLPRSQATR